MSAEICVDANLVIKWYTYENLHEEAVSLLDESDRLGMQLIAPDLIFAETGSTIRKLVHRGILSAENGWMAISLMKRVDIKRYDVRDLYDDAWRIAEKHNLPVLYDAYYMALAELRGCDFWTADERFINSVQGIAHVRHIRDFSPGVLESQL
ncbi:MAG: type II toxin-antitoxin system VapC family toxin [Armatimonadota bacterium]